MADLTLDQLDDMLGFVVDRDEARGGGKCSEDDVRRIASEMIAYFGLKDEVEYDTDAGFLELEIDDLD